MNRRQRLTAEILERLEAFSTWRSVPATPVEALVATILSQNTSDVNSTRAWEQLRADFPTWDAIADADPAVVAKSIRCGGLADQKSRTIIDALVALRERHGGFELEKFAALGDEELLRELTSLRGVGLKTAACVLMFSLDRDLCAIDTHIHRVVNRIGLVATRTAERTFEELRPLVPPGRARDLHVALIRFGRHVCKARRPHCFACPLFDLCTWDEKDRVAAEGLPGPRAASGDVVLSDVIGSVRGSWSAA